MIYLVVQQCSMKMYTNDADKEEFLYTESEGCQCVHDYVWLPEIIQLQCTPQIIPTQEPTPAPTHYPRFTPTQAPTKSWNV